MRRLLFFLLIFVVLSTGFLAAAGDLDVLWTGCARTRSSVLVAPEVSEGAGAFEVRYPDKRTGNVLWTVTGKGANAVGHERDHFLVEGPYLVHHAWEKTVKKETSRLDVRSAKGEIKLEAGNGSRASFLGKVLIRYFLPSESGEFEEKARLKTSDLGVEIWRNPIGRKERYGRIHTARPVSLQSREFAITAGSGLDGAPDLSRVSFKPPVRSIINIKRRFRLAGQRKKQETAGPVEFSADGELLLENNAVSDGLSYQRITLSDNVRADQDNYSLFAEKIEIYLDPRVVAGDPADRFLYFDATGGVALKRGPILFAGGESARGTRLSASGIVSYDLVMRGEPQAFLRDAKTEVFADRLTFMHRVELENAHYAYLNGDVRASIERKAAGGWVVSADSIEAELDWKRFEKQRKSGVRNDAESARLVRRMKATARPGGVVGLSYDNPAGAWYRVEGRTLVFDGERGAAMVSGGEDFRPCVKSASDDFAEADAIRVLLPARKIVLADNVRMALFTGDPLERKKKKRFWEMRSDSAKMSWRDEPATGKNGKTEIKRRVESLSVRGEKENARLVDKPAPGESGPERTLSARTIVYDPANRTASTSKENDIRPRISSGSDFLEADRVSMTRSGETSTLAACEGDVRGRFTPERTSAKKAGPRGRIDFFTPWKFKARKVSAAFLNRAREKTGASSFVLDNAALTGGVKIENEHSGVGMSGESAVISGVKETVAVRGGKDGKPRITYGDEPKSFASANEIRIAFKPLEESGLARMFLSGEAFADVRWTERTGKSDRWAVSAERVIIYYRSENRELVGARLEGGVRFENKAEGGPFRGVTLSGDEGYFDAAEGVFSVQGNARGTRGETELSDEQILINTREGYMEGYSLNQKKPWKIDPSGMESFRKSGE